MFFPQIIIFCDYLRFTVDTVEEAENNKRIFLVSATQKDPSGYSWDNWQVMYFNAIYF